MVWFRVDERVCDSILSNNDIFRLHKMLETCGINHDFINCKSDTESWYQIVYPSLDEWKALKDTNPKDECCSVIQLAYEDGLQMLGLKNNAEKALHSDNDVIFGLQVYDIFERIKKVEQHRQTLLRHFAVI